MPGLPNFPEADTIRILVATDNHVGYGELDPVRKADSWTTFHEIMCLAKERDVDMVLLAGDLFHDNKPSRQAMFEVMRSLRMYCYGEKPCELEMLSDASEQFGGSFNHVNYEDPDINVSIPVFSIHGNHDDPAGDDRLASLDILQMSGLLNYFGRTPQVENIDVKPILLQKGSTKLGLYGLSNVRDERLFRTFRDGKVKFFQPGVQKDDWYNVICVHQNHHAHTDTGYLPEHFLPSFLDLVIWGHEHECDIEPRINPETGFKVMQPGSSVATSLVAGEAVPKHVSILNIYGQQMHPEHIRLKTPRPFVMKEIVLSDSREMRDLAFTEGHSQRPKITRYLEGIVNELIQEANQEWWKLQDNRAQMQADGVKPPLPLIRLRVEYTPPEGGHFEPDNPQRFSNRFIDKVANVNDVLQLYRKRKITRTTRTKADMPEDSVMERINLDDLEVSKLVQEFLSAQSLTILPQNRFSAAVDEFIAQNDNEIMSNFVTESLTEQVKQLIVGNREEDEDFDAERISELMGEVKARLEARYTKEGPKDGGRKSQTGNGNADADDFDEAEEEAVPKRATARGGKTTKGGKAAAAATTRATATNGRKAPARATNGRGKKKQIFDEDEDGDEDGDVIMIDDDDDDDDDASNGITNDNDDDEDDELFLRPTAKKAAPAKKAPAKPAAKAAPAKATSARGAAPSKQSQLSFGGSTASRTNGAATTRSRAGAASKPPARSLREPSEDEISDDDDAFEPPPTGSSRPLRR